MFPGALSSAGGCREPQSPTRCTPVMRALIATLLAVALLAPAARAKGPSFTEVCGASECRSVEDRRIRNALLGDAEQISPPRAGPSSPFASWSAARW